MKLFGQLSLKGKFTREDVEDHKLPFLDCAVYIEEAGSLNTEVYRKPTHTDQYLLFDSHHPLEYKLAAGLPSSENDKSETLESEAFGR